MISVKNLGKTFPLRKAGRRQRNQMVEKDPREHGDVFNALRGVSFTAPKGKVIGLLGSNGAGKTTLLRLLSTSLKPTTGTATIDGVDVVQSPIVVRRKIGFLSGTTGLYGRMSPRELLSFFGDMYGLSSDVLQYRIRQLFAELDIGQYADRQCDQLSTGMKQKVSIARSLVHDPEVIIFDEPTTGLDVAAAQTILDFIQRCGQQQKSVIFSTHHMHEVQKLCDWIVIIHQGEKCFEGTVAQLLSETGQSHLDEAYLSIINYNSKAGVHVAAEVAHVD